MKTCRPLKKGLLKSLISDHGTMFSSLGQRPNTKFHSVIITKRHTEDLRTMTDQEWADTLPVLKESVKKVENYYKFRGKPGPLGYRVSIPVGELSGANQPPHFYMRVVPKYKKDWGTRADSPLSYGRHGNEEQWKELQTALLLNQNRIIAEKNKVVAKLHGDDLGFASVFTKAHLPNDINAIDQETWNEIGQTLKELMVKIEANTNFHDFTFRIELGKEAAKVWREEGQVPTSYDFSDSELVVNLFPRNKMKRWWWENQGRQIIDGKYIGHMENERLAEKLNEPEKYTQEWGKKSTPSLRGHEEETIPSTKSSPSETSPERESLWKQSSTYLIFASGIGITCLGLGIYWLFSKKAKAKSK